MDETAITTSPELIEGALRYLYPKDTEAAPVTAVMKYMTELVNKGLTKEEFAEATIAYKTLLEKGYQEGRDSWGRDFDDTARDLLRGAGIAAGASKALAPALALKNPGAAAVSLAVSGALSTAKDIGENALDLTPVKDWVTKERNVFKTYATHQMVEDHRKFGSKYIRDFHDVCLQDQVCQEVAGMVYPDLATARDRVDVRPGAVVTAFPDLISSQVQVTVQTDLSIVIDLDDLKQSLTDQFTATTGELHNDLVDVSTELRAIKNEQTNLIAWLRDIDAQEKARQREEQLRAKIQQRWDYAQKGIEVAGAIAGLFDKKLGNDIRRVGGAGLTAVKAGMQLVEAANTLSKGLTVATAIGSAAATGNFIGAAFALIGAFAPSGPPPEQIILDEIGALREDMKNLHSEMSDRFDRIDRTLRTVYVDVMAQLDKIDISLKEVIGGVDEVLDDLERIEATLMRHQMTLVSFFQTTHREDLQIAYMTALGRPKASHTPAMSREEFSAAEGLFRTWAAIISGNKVEVPAETWTPETMTETAVIDHLRGPALEHVGYINKLVAHWGWPAFAPTDSDQQLHNAYTWVLAAGAYSQLEREWPAFAAQATSANPNVYRDEVATPGKKLLAAMHSIPKRHNGDLLQYAIGHFQAKYSAYGSALEAAEAAWAESGAPTQLLGALDPTRPSVLREDPHHEYGYLPTIPVWLEGAAAPEPALAFPLQAVARIPALLRNAHRLNLPHDGKHLRVVVSTQRYGWAEEVQVEECEWIEHGPIGDPPILEPEPMDPRPPRPQPTKHCWTVTETVHRTGMKGTVTVFYRQQPVHQYNLDSPYTTDIISIWNSHSGWAKDIASLGWTPFSIDEAPALADIESSREWLLKSSCFKWLWDRQYSENANEPLRVAARNLNGALRLLNHLLELGLSTARTNDEGMRTAIDGSPIWEGGAALFTADQFLQSLQFVGAHSSPSPLRRSFQSCIEEAVREPMTLLKDRIVAYQTALEAGQYTEFHREIELTLQRLEVAGTIVEATREGTQRSTSPPSPASEALPAPEKRILTRRRL